MEAVRLERLAVETMRQQLLNEHLTNIALVGSERHQIQQDIAAMKKQRDEAFATIEKMQQDWSHVLRSKPIKYIFVSVSRKDGVLTPRARETCGPRSPLFVEFRFLLRSQIVGT